MRSLKVLILEDNPIQLLVLHQMLNALRFFDVLTAESVDCARVSLLRRGAIDVAICDLYMEGASGQELISELALERKAAALIILSAAAPPVVERAARVARSQGLRVLGCLSKPVTIGALGQLLGAFELQQISADGANAD